MKKNDVVRYKGKYLRVLNITNDKALVIDCVKKYMPYWTDLFNEAEVVDISTIYKLNNKPQENIEEISSLRRSEAYKRYALISGVASLISNKELYIELIAEISEENKISDQTIRKYLIEYLIYQDISVLAPKIKTEKELTDNQKNFRWALNKFYYNRKKHSLNYAYNQMLKFKYSDENGI